MSQTDRCPQHTTQRNVAGVFAAFETTSRTRTGEGKTPGAQEHAVLSLAQRVVDGEADAGDEDAEEHEPVEQHVGHNGQRANGSVWSSRKRKAAFTLRSCRGIEGTVVRECVTPA